jgi:ABC-type phosphate transport system substrate-binding protein
MLFAKRLMTKVFGVFLAAFLAVVAASQPFDVLTFHWTQALTIAGSAAVLALLEGLAGRFTGDTDDPGVLR